jgi:hypothetical protein
MDSLSPKSPCMSNSASSQENSEPEYTVGLGRATLYYCEGGWELLFGFQHLPGPGRGHLNIDTCPLVDWKWFQLATKQSKPFLRSDLPRVLKNIETALTKQYYRCTFFESNRDQRR